MVTDAGLVWSPASPVGSVKVAVMGNVPPVVYRQTPLGPAKVCGVPGVPQVTERAVPGKPLGQLTLTVTIPWPVGVPTERATGLAVTVKVAEAVTGCPEVARYPFRVTV